MADDRLRGGGRVPVHSVAGLSRSTLGRERAMADDRPSAGPEQDDAEVLDPAPGSLERTASGAAKPRSGVEGAADGIIDMGVRVATPFVRFGWRTVRGVGKRLGVNPAVERQVGKALDSDTAARTTRARARDPGRQPGLGQGAGERAGAEAGRAGAPRRPRCARRSPRRGWGCSRTCGARARRAARGLDDAFERCLQAPAPAPSRAERPIYAGGATRLLAIGFDALVLSGILLLIAAIVSACSTPSSRSRAATQP